MNRRQFLAASSLLAMAGLPAIAQEGAAAVSEAPPGGLTVITYNVLACRGYPKTRANAVQLAEAASDMPARFARELGLYKPGIVTFQESPPEATVAAIAKEMGMNHVFFPPGWPGDADWPGGFPGAVITQFPIVEQENCPFVDGVRPEDLFTRHWGRAVVKTDTEEVSIYSVHLHPSDDAIREREVTEILRVLEPALKSGRSLLFQGDLNHRPDGPEYARWTEAGLVDALAAKGDPGASSVPSVKPRSRIDYIWAHGPIAERLTECRVLFEGAFRTDPADSESFALSDHLPVMARFA